MKNLLFLRLQISIIMSQGVIAQNTNLTGILQKLADKPENKEFNSCRFFILSLLQRKTQFLDQPEHQLWKFLPECQNSSQDFPALVPYSNEIRKTSWDKIRKWVSKIQDRRFSEDKFTPKPLTTPEEFFSLCLEVVNARFRLSSNKQNDLSKFISKFESILPNLQSHFSNLQITFLRNLLLGFPQSSLLHFPQKINKKSEVKLSIILLIITVTSYCLSFINENWIFSQIIKAFQNRQRPPIFLNFKNILIMNDALHKNIQGRKFYQCKSCKTPFSIGNCGKADSIGRCIKCKKEIGGQSHKMNSNTEEIDIKTFQNNIMNDPNYFVNRYDIDLNHKYGKFSPFTFRIAHCFIHALYLGLGESGIFQQNQVFHLLLPNFQMNFSELKIPNSNLGLFFYRHVDRDLETIQKILKKNSQPVKFITSILHKIHEAKQSMLSQDLKKSERTFRKKFQNFETRYNETMQEIEKLEEDYKGSVPNGNLSRKLVAREVNFSQVSHKVDHFLYIMLRENSDLDLINFELELENYKKMKPEVDLSFLDFYIFHMDLMNEGFDKIILPLYQMGIFMNENFSFCIPRDILMETNVSDYIQQMKMTSKSPIDNEILREFEKLYKNFVLAWKEIMKLSDKHENIFKFRFECNQNAGITIQQETVTSGDFKLIHLVFSQIEREAMNSIIVLDTLIPNFNNLLSNFIPKNGFQTEVIKISKLKTKNLKLFRERKLKKLIFKRGMTNPDFERQTEVFFDFQGIQNKIKTKIFDKFRQVRFDKNKLPQFRSEGERSNISEMIEDYEDLLKLEEIPNEYYLQSSFEKRVSQLQKTDQISCYNIIVSVIHKVISLKEKDRNLTIANFIHKREIMIPTLSNINLTLIENISLQHILILMRVLELNLVESHFLSKVPSYLQETLVIKNEEKFMKELRNIKRETRKHLHLVLTLCIVRNSVSIDFKTMKYKLWDYLQYSSVSEELMVDPLVSDNSAQKLIEEHGVLVEHLQSFFERVLRSL